MEDANDLLQVAEQIKKGVISNKIPAHRVILILAYTLGTYRVTVKKVSFNNDIDLVSVLLKEIQQSVIDGLINYDIILPLLKSFNDSFSSGENLIDCDADPFIPDGWKIEEHKKSGLLKFDPLKISLYQSRKQKQESVTGNSLKKTLVNKPMNANVLDYLLTYPELIPDSWKPNDWKGKHIFFWGTIYRHSDGRLCVRYLYWNSTRWGWSYRIFIKTDLFLSDKFDANDYAALFEL